MNVPFNHEQLEDIYMIITDTSLQKSRGRAPINVFDDEPVAYGQREQVQ